MSNPAYSIKTERLFIRCFDPKDAPVLKKAIDESLDHLSTWLEWTANEPEETEKKIQRLRNNRAEFDLGQNYKFAIFLSDQTTFIGSIALMRRVGDNALEIGYWIHKDYLSKGYATEATKALVRIGFEIEKIERIEIHCDPNNLSSQSIPRKIGFQNEAIIRENDLDNHGIRKKSMIWVMFKDEYAKLDAAQYPIEAFDVIGRKIL